MRLARSEVEPDLRLFDEAESELVARALIALSQIAPGDASILSRLMSQLADINHIISQTPSLSRSAICLRSALVPSRPAHSRRA